MKKILFVLLIIFPIFLVSCSFGTSFFSKNTAQNRTDKIEDLGKPDYLSEIQNEYTFIVITDVHFGAEKSTVPQKRFFEWMDQKKENNELPVFCLSLGDDADHGAENEMIEYQKFSHKIEAYGIPVFNTIGNHDLYNSGWKYWQEYAAGEKQGMVQQKGSAYRFLTNNLSFYSLDSGTAVFGTEQVDSLKEWFETDNRPKVIFTHYPVYIDKILFCKEDTIERNLLLDIMAKNNVKLYFGGHVHLYDREDFGKYQTFTLPSLNFQASWTLVTIKESEDDFTYELKLIR